MNLTTNRKMNRKNHIVPHTRPSEPAERSFTNLLAAKRFFDTGPISEPLTLSSPAVNIFVIPGARTALPLNLSRPRRGRFLCHAWRSRSTAADLRTLHTRPILHFYRFMDPLARTVFHIAEGPVFRVFRCTAYG